MKHTPISAKIIAKSKSLHTGVTIVTYELEYPRFFHAQVMTHRALSKNSSSSRAIPINRMIDLVEENTATPIYWGVNQKGMQANVELSEHLQTVALEEWYKARDFAIQQARTLARLGVHKQIVNRILEPYQMMKVIMTGTNYDNFYALRLESLDKSKIHAQPEIWELARLMYEENKKTPALTLQKGEWHTPYYRNGYWSDVHLEEYGESLDTALKISTSCCAQVSYRLLDDSIDKALDIYKKLTESDPIHASAFEHCATPIAYNINEGMYVLNTPNRLDSWQKGITHVRRDNTLCSGNFEDFIQYRQLIPKHECRNFTLKV